MKMQSIYGNKIDKFIYLSFVYYVYRGTVHTLWKRKYKHDVEVRTGTRIVENQALHGNAAEKYYRRILPCMEMGPRTTIIQS